MKMDKAFMHLSLASAEIPWLDTFWFSVILKNVSINNNCIFSQLYKKKLKKAYILKYKFYLCSSSELNFIKPIVYSRIYRFSSHSIANYNRFTFKWTCFTFGNKIYHLKQLGLSMSSRTFICILTINNYWVYDFTYLAI